MTNRHLIHLAAVLLVAGVAFVTLAKLTPWHSNEEFYELRGAIEARAYDVERPDYDALTREFHALENRYQTNKWLYADAGYLLISLSLVVAIVGAVTDSTDALFRSTHNRFVVVSLFALSYLATFGSIVAAAMHTIGRYHVPPWADSIGIPIFAALSSALVLAIPVGAFVLWPLLRSRTVSKPLIYFRAGLGSYLATLVYGPAAAGLVLLAVWQAQYAGAWLATPALVIMAWLVLNTRVLATTPTTEKSD